MDLSNIKDGIMMHASEKLQGKKLYTLPETKLLAG
jgi:hypothetical protein